MDETETSGPVVSGTWSPPRKFSGFGVKRTPSYKPSVRKWFQSKRRKEKNTTDLKEGKEQDGCSTNKRLSCQDLEIMNIQVVSCDTTDVVPEDWLEDDLDGYSVDSAAHEELRKIPPKINSMAYTDDDSFDTTSTVSVTSGSNELDDLFGLFYCEESSAAGAVRFADEKDLPMEQVADAPVRVVEDQQDAEVVVLCLDPERKKFEFLQIRYYVRDLIDPETQEVKARASIVSDLLHNLPEMCSDVLFENTTFDMLYRTEKTVGKGGKSNVRVHRMASHFQLSGCHFHNAADILVAAASGSTCYDVKKGVNPLLNNAMVMRMLTKARRSHRALKLIPLGSPSKSPARLGLTKISGRKEAALDAADLSLDEEEEEDKSTSDDVKRIEEKASKVEEEEGSEFDDEVRRAIVLISSLTAVFYISGV
ncbi:MAG: hypothetical protein SGILL_003755 [Bacillariaceae sp.]